MKWILILGNAVCPGKISQILATYIDLDVFKFPCNLSKKLKEGQ